ncbi:hypothetical protein ACSBR1_007069 [Camellia fascicularis]
MHQNTHTIMNDNKRIDRGEERHGRINKAFILQLPCHVVIEILCKLPMKALGKCRCVCKAWRDLFLDPHFTESHFSRAHTCLLVQSKSSRYADSRTLCLIEFGVLRIDAVMNIRQPNLPKFGIGLVNSCNGLVCMQKNGRLYLSNPTMGGEHLTLPVATEDLSIPFVCGFGCSQKGNQYKVVQIFNQLSFHDKWVAKICTVSSGTWRCLGDVPHPFRYRLVGIYLNGFLHWLLDYPQSSELIYAFDLESEKFQPVPPPPTFSIYPGGNICWLNLGVMEGQLCISCFKVDIVCPDIDIWVMKDYGVGKSWTRDLVIKHPREGWWDPYGFQLIKVLKNGGVLLLYYFSPFVYNPVTETFRKAQIEGIKSQIEAIVHVPSFVSLKSVSREEILKEEDCHQVQAAPSLSGQPSITMLIQ